MLVFSKSEVDNCGCIPPRPWLTSVLFLNCSLMTARLCLSSTVLGGTRGTLEIYVEEEESENAKVKSMQGRMMCNCKWKGMTEDAAGDHESTRKAWLGLIVSCFLELLSAGP